MLKAIKSNFIFAPSKENLQIKENSYIILDEGIVIGIYENIPEKFATIEKIDLNNYFIIPGFNDIHIHAPQLPNAGNGLDDELIPWLNKYTFPLESKYSNIDFSKHYYKNFINTLWLNGTMRACVFGTIHKESTEILFDLYEKSGLRGLVGKVNMDRNSIPSLIETCEQSLYDTEYLINKYNDRNRNVSFILTPRFVPSTSEKLMTGLGKLVEKYDLKVQSHLCENRNEIKWVKEELHPNIESFAKVYDYFNLMPKNKTTMAHCVYLDEKEIQLLLDKEVLIGHCPTSNMDLSSGIMPARKYFNNGLKIALGSDVGGGHLVNMAKNIVDAINVSKINWVYKNDENSLNVNETFYLATKGSGQFFGKVGSFENGYDFDALVISMDNFDDIVNNDFKSRLEKFLYCGDDRNILKRFSKGKEIEKPFQ